MPQSAANKSLLASSTGPRRSSYTQCGAKKEAPWWEEGASHIGLSCCACTVQVMLADDPVRAMHRAGGGACWCWCWWVLCWCWCVSQLCARVCVCVCVCGGGLCGGQPQYLFETLDSLPPPAPTMQAAELATKRVHGMEVRIEKLTKQVLLPLILPLSSFHPIITSQ